LAASAATSSGGTESGAPASRFVAVNDLTSAATLAHLLKYDSVHGKYPDEVSATDDGLMVAGNRVAVLSERDPAALPWADMGVEIVLESTGFFTKREGAAKHLAAGARKVVISAAGHRARHHDLHGVNDQLYDASSHHVISKRLLHHQLAWRRWRRCCSTPSA